MGVNPKAQERYDALHASSAGFREFCSSNYTASHEQDVWLAASLLFLSGEAEEFTEWKCDDYKDYYDDYKV